MVDGDIPPSLMVLFSKEQYKTILCPGKSISCLDLEIDLLCFGCKTLLKDMQVLTLNNNKSTKKLHLVSFNLAIFAYFKLSAQITRRSILSLVSSSYASSSSSSPSTGRSLQKICSDSRSQIRSTTERKIKMRHNQVAPQPNPQEQTLICPTAMIKWAITHFCT